MKISDYISKDDFAFSYGFSIFETFYVNSNGNIFLLSEHIVRLLDSLFYFSLDTSLSAEDFKHLILTYITKNDVKNKVLRLSVTNGNPAKNIYPQIIISIRDVSNTKKALTLKISNTRRNETSKILRHKTSNYLENFIEGSSAVQSGYDDALFLNTKNYVSETTKSNIFFVKNNTLYTPDINAGILPGIIRNWILNFAKKHSIECVEGSFTLKQFINAEGTFVTNSVIGIVPIVKINNTIVKNNSSLTSFLIKQLSKELCV